MITLLIFTVITLSIVNYLIAQYVIPSVLKIAMSSLYNKKPLISTDDRNDALDVIESIFDDVQFLVRLDILCFFTLLFGWLIIPDQLSAIFLFVLFLQQIFALYNKYNYLTELYSITSNNTPPP